MSKTCPEGYHTLNTSFVFIDSRKAIEFYKKAFGAKEKEVMPGPDGKGVMHAALTIGDSIFMMNDEILGPQCKSAETLGGSPISLYLYFDDADAVFMKAVAAGATVQMPVQDMFWGDRVGQVKDPFGYSWSIATHKKDLTQDQIAKAAQAFFASAAAH